ITAGQLDVARAEGGVEAAGVAILAVLGQLPDDPARSIGEGNASACIHPAACLGEIRRAEPVLVQLHCPICTGKRRGAERKRAPPGEIVAQCPCTEGRPEPLPGPAARADDEASARHHTFTRLRIDPGLRGDGAGIAIDGLLADARLESWLRRRRTVVETAAASGLAGGQRRESQRQNGKAACRSANGTEGVRSDGFHQYTRALGAIFLRSIPPWSWGVSGSVITGR